MTPRVGSATLALVVLGLPFLSFLLLAAVRPLRRSAPAAALVSIAAIAGSLVTAVLTARGATPRPAPVSASTTRCTASRSRTSSSPFTRWTGAPATTSVMRPLP